MDRITLDIGKLWTPLPTQQKCLDTLALAQPADPFVRMIDYTGSLGSGKSWYLCRAMIGLSLAYPGIKTLLGRFNYTELRDTTLVTFHTLVADLDEALRSQAPAGTTLSVGVWNSGEMEYRWPNGSVIKFRSLEGAETKYKSLDIASFGVDEADQVTEPAVSMLIGRCRQLGYPRVGLLANNPTSRRHWIYKWFVEEKARIPAQREHYTIYRTNSTENKAHLPPGYIEDLRSRYDPIWIQKYLDGEWAESDQERPIFPAFRPTLHVARAPLGWQKNRPLYVGVDWGFRAPGVVWAQIDPDNRLVILKTWAPRELDTYKLAVGLKRRTDEWFPGGEIECFGGHDANRRVSSAKETDAQIFRAHGLPVRYKPAPIERGFNIIRNLLDMRDDGEPGLLISPDDSTRRLIAGFDGRYVYAPDKDEPVQDPDYSPLFDALRYIIIHLYDLAGDPHTVKSPRAGRYYAFRRVR